MASDALLGSVTSVDECARYRDVDLALETVLGRPDVLLDREGFGDGEASIGCRRGVKIGEESVGLSEHDPINDSLVSRGIDEE